MLAKLIAFDLRTYRKMLWKPLLICLGIFLIATVTTRYVEGITIFIAIMALIVAAGFIVYTMVSHYYRHFYTHQGYLTHTLPTTPSQKLWAKFISGFILHVLAIVGVGLGLYLLFYVSFRDLMHSKFFMDMIKGFFDAIGPATVWVFVISLFLAYISFFATYSLSISVGMNKFLQRFGGGGIALAFVGIYLVQQLVNLVNFFTPLSVRIFLNPRWHQMIQVVNEQPFGSMSILAESDDLVPEIAYMDVGVLAIVYSIVFVIFSFLWVRREIKLINLR
ncbi:MAG TPA: hypothetical protein GX733_04870 [Tissierellia bacterium]|jgi:hypothetical protein|nr:hypothetical protein [Tissierellia bacterium]